jgi:glutathione S-transferase
LTEALSKILGRTADTLAMDESSAVRPSRPVLATSRSETVPAAALPPVVAAEVKYPTGGFYNPYARPMPSLERAKLYMHPVSMTSRPIRLFIAESGIKLQEQLVDLMKGEHLAPDFTGRNPSQMVPMLEDGDFRLTESSAILKYLADKVGSPAYPSDRVRRAKIDEMMDWLNTQFYRDWAYNLCYPQIFPHHKRRSDEAHAGTIEWGKHNSRRWLQVLNDHWIGNNQYLVGNQITLADYFGAGLVTLGETIHVDFSKYPNVARWLGNMKKLKSWERVNEVFNGLVASTRGKAFETL